MVQIIVTKKLSLIYRKTKNFCYKHFTQVVRYWPPFIVLSPNVTKKVSNEKDVTKMSTNILYFLISPVQTNIIEVKPNMASVS